nr:histidine kinase [uncultured Roseateles sp.]
MIPYDKIDWSQLWYPGPTRRFTPAEIRRAGGETPSATLSMVLMLNAAMLGLTLLQAAPPRLTGVLSAWLIGLIVSAMGLGKIVWRSPSRRVMSLCSLGFALVWAACAVAAKHTVNDPVRLQWTLQLLLGGIAVATVCFWFVAIYRSHQIELRLRELGERERAEELGRQLADAQIQPHFLFNSLASLQHWVQTKDDRAGPLLASLTGYLRATLPLFNRRQLQVGEELPAVQHYLEVMQARLGARLSWQIEVDEAVRALSLPPALLLTLVENAVEHGVQAALHGGSVHLLGRLDGGRALIEVRDTGPGLAPGATEGTGLNNCRERLRQAYGDRARLSLGNAAEGGCVARLEFPFVAQ